MGLVKCLGCNAQTQSCDAAHVDIGCTRQKCVSYETALYVTRGSMRGVMQMERLIDRYRSTWYVRKTSKTLAWPELNAGFYACAENFNLICAGFYFLIAVYPFLFVVQLS